MPEQRAVFAPIDGTPIERAAFVPADRPYQRCTRCVMDTTDPEISFDAHGVCSHCRHFDRQIRVVWPTPEAGARQLELTLAKMKAEGRGKRYDCIIGLSGGVDSSYLCTKAFEWGLRPLAVHVDAGWNSELAVMNIEQICKRLDIDLVTHVVDWEQMRDMQLAFLRSNLANQDVPQDHAFFAALYGYAENAGIKHVLSGRNYATESVLPAAWGYTAMDATHIRAIHKRFGTGPRDQFPIVSFYRHYIKHRHLLGMKDIALLNMIPYDKRAAIEVLERDYGWRYYGGKHYESRWTRFFQAYYLPYKFGYDKRKAHLSSMVVCGQITRDEALDELKRPLYDPKQLAEDKQFVSKKLGITVEELDALIAQPPRHFTEFPHHGRKLAAYHRFLRLRRWLRYQVRRVRNRLQMMR